jgi:hypothetical protein
MFLRGETRRSGSCSPVLKVIRRKVGGIAEILARAAGNGNQIETVQAFLKREHFFIQAISY